MTSEEADTRMDGATVTSPVIADLGLSIDMLDVDRLREWARLILEHGSDISYWGDRMFVVSKMQTMATCIEHAVRDIGRLRELSGLTGAPTCSNGCVDCADESR